MHQTTVRFSSDLWHALRRAADLAGVSVAQYVREAALARLAHSRGSEGLPYESVWEPAQDDAEEAAAEPVSPRSRAEQESEANRAVRGQGAAARKRSEQLRGESEDLRGSLKEDQE